MKLKTKPVKPVRNIGVEEVIEPYFDLSSLEGSIGDAIARLEEIGKTPGYYDITIMVEHDYESTNLVIKGKRDETKEEFAKRLARYNERAAEYEAWYVANKDKIEQTITERKERAERKKEADIARLEKEIRRIRAGRR